MAYFETLDDCGTAMNDTGNDIYEIVNGQISASSRHLSKYLEELTHQVDLIERHFYGTMERIAAWDDEEMIILDLKEVLFFTSEGGQNYVVTRKAKYKMRETLDILETKLGRRNFFRCHRGFIVNLKFISKISPWLGNNSYLSKLSGTEYEIPVSRYRIKEMKKALEIE